jgi:hypothetical protein
MKRPSQSRKGWLLGALAILAILPWLIKGVLRQMKYSFKES